MKLKTFLKATLTGLACLGIFLPADLMAAPPEAKGKPTGVASLSGKVTPSSTAASGKSQRAKTRIIDVELAKGGTLNGEVINGKNATVTKAVVSVRTAKEEVGRSLSNESGQFSVEKVPAGTFYIVAGTGHGVYRLWKNGTAPKMALKQIRIVSDRTVVRAQNDGEVLYDDDGTAFGQVRVADPDAGAYAFSPGPGGGFAGGLSGAGIGMGGGMLSGLGIFDAVVVGGTITGVTLGVINHENNEDLEEAFERRANSTN